MVRLFPSLPPFSNSSGVWDFLYSIMLSRVLGQGELLVEKLDRDSLSVL